MTMQNYPGSPVESGYIPVNGLEMYYEIHGSGQPLVLLHGNLSTIGTSFGKVLPQLASMRRIIAVEQQGHGHTADIECPFSLEQWAQDTSALLRHLGIEQADFFGYSSGAQSPWRSLCALPPWFVNSSGLGGPVTSAMDSTPNCWRRARL